MLTESEILKIEGIVVRHIPKYTTSLYKYNENLHSNNSNIVIMNGIKFVKEEHLNSMYGYIITIQKDQMSYVRFNRNKSGTGSTIQSAYLNLINKTKGNQS